MYRRFAVRVALVALFSAPLASLSYADAPSAERVAAHPVVVLRTANAVRRFRVDPTRQRASGPYQLHLAHDEATGETVAIKLEAVGAAAAGHPGAGFDAEYQAASSSSHPHVIQPLGLGTMEGDSDRGVVVFQIHGSSPAALASPLPVAAAYSRIVDNANARALGDETFGADPRADARRSARAMAYLLSGVDSDEFGAVAHKLPADLRPANTAPAAHAPHDKGLHQTLALGMTGQFESPDAFLAAMKPFADGTPLVPQKKYWVKPWFNKQMRDVTYKLELNPLGWATQHFWRPGMTAYVHFNAFSGELRVTDTPGWNDAQVDPRRAAIFKNQAHGSIFAGPAHGGQSGQIVVE